MEPSPQLRSEPKYFHGVFINRMEKRACAVEAVSKTAPSTSSDRNRIYDEMGGKATFDKQMSGGKSAADIARATGKLRDLTVEAILAAEKSAEARDAAKAAMKLGSKIIGSIFAPFSAYYDYKLLTDLGVSQKAAAATATSVAIAEIALPLIGAARTAVEVGLVVGEVAGERINNAVGEWGSGLERELVKALGRGYL